MPEESWTSPSDMSPVLVTEDARSPETRASMLTLR